MTSESRRSSAAGSAHPSSCDAEDDTAADESQTMGDAEPGTTPSSAVVDDLRGTAADRAIAPTIESQPMTTSNSASSSHSVTEATGLGSASTSTYGTRSRNRTGNSRPNYAEDKEIDAEFELPSVKEKTTRKTNRGGDATPAADGGQPSIGTYRSSGPETDSDLGNQDNQKDYIPGTSTFSANLSVLPSKKRKATSQLASVAAQHQLQATIQNLPLVQSTTQRGGSIAQVVAGFRETNMLSFDGCGGRLKDNRLIADDGTILALNDHAYLVCEPPGEPYYLGRIMEFLHVNNDSTQPIDALRLNWYYRPKDIGRKVNDTRQVFASMHSDISPLTALRGKCQIKHKSEVGSLDELRRSKDSFWYEKLYDRYIHRFYDVIPTSQVINVPVEVKKVLDERWKYIVVEPGRGKELTSAVKSCKRCNKYCASNDSVDCAVCRNTYHMSCVNPPLLKKPSRGFAWACGPCSKAQEKKLEARNTPNVTDPATEMDEEAADEEVESPDGVVDQSDDGRASPSAIGDAQISFHPGTAEQIHQASLWQFRYLGIHCKVEDALDYDDRIYPRASSRLGPRHQANVPIWPGCPVEYVKPVEIKRKYMKGGGQKKDVKLSKETVAALEADKIAKEQRPKWVMDEPPGYVARGEDYDNDDERNTAQLLYKRPEVDEVSAGHDDGSALDESEREQLVFHYMARAGRLARPLGLPELSTNLLDVAIEALRSHDFEPEKALTALINSDRKIFKEPELTAAELKKFEDGVAKYGSEWHSVKKHVKTLKARDVVRFYYTWKKTERGKQVWGNYSGRKGKKEAKKAEVTVGKLQDDVADEYDDSAFDNDKAFEKKRGFECKFCTTRSSRQWRRAPSTPAGTMIPENPGAKLTGKDKGAQLMVALCRRCAELWRRYAIQWEDVDELAKKLAQAGNRTWKRKIDDELLKELAAANEVVNHLGGTPFVPVSTGGTPAPASSPAPGNEPARKKAKGDVNDPALDSVVIALSGQKKKVASIKTAATIPPTPEIPRPKTLPCAICGELDSANDQLLACRECRMSVHKNCYGVVGDNRSPAKWACDMCSNDKNPQVSVQYKCMLCPVDHTEHDFVEPAKSTQKKRTEKERERERVERENNLKAAEYYRRKQEESNKPVNPREPLKRTANNNWVHVTCAVFTPEVKFGNAKALEPSEGIPSIPSARYDEVCAACKQKGGSCVACHCCRTPVHVECAHQAGYILGFDIVPVKGSRRDQINVVKIDGEVGLMTAAVWCKEHIPTKTIVHQMHDIVNDAGLIALQLYVQNFKQADLTLTGTVRKATLVHQSTKVINPASGLQPLNRRASTATSSGINTLARGSVSHIRVEEGTLSAKTPAENVCTTCRVDISPRWWPFPSTAVYRQDPARFAASAEPNGDHVDAAEIPTLNGNMVHSAPGESNNTMHAALAAAALHQKTKEAAAPSTEVQCHQCHWKKIKKESNSPPPSVPVSQVAPLEPLRPSLPASTANGSLPAEPEVVHQAARSAHYAWPLPPAYPPSGPHSWSRHTSTPQSMSLVNQLNGGHAPLINQLSSSHSSQIGSPSLAQSPVAQAQLRQSNSSLPRSPHQNGHVNGYPPSPHRMALSPSHISNGTYASFVSAGLSPQHLTNGGPPPRAPEHPFLQGHPPAAHHSSFPPSQGSPPPLRDPQLQGRDIVNPQSSARPANGRVNGGASASPSLRNLLS